MRRVTPNRAIAFCILGFSGYWGLASVVDPADLQSIFNSLSFGVCFIVCLTWAQAAFHELGSSGSGEDGEPRDPGEWAIVLGIFMIFLVLALQRITAIVSDFVGNPEWIVDGPIPGFFPFSITIIGSLFLVAPGLVRQGESSTRVGSYIVAAAAIGGALAGFAAGRAV